MLLLLRLRLRLHLVLLSLPPLVLRPLHCLLLRRRVRLLDLRVRPPRLRLLRPQLPPLLRLRSRPPNAAVLLGHTLLGGGVQAAQIGLDGALRGGDLVHLRARCVVRRVLTYKHEQRGGGRARAQLARALSCCCFTAFRNSATRAPSSSS